MSILDFKEIPKAHIPNGQQDTFELFARDFFESIGFKIIEGPDRGNDGGRDLIIEEIRKGIIENTKIRWIVSCKHKIHSGKAVLDSDEINITDRIKKHNANGFIGFYSTLPSSTLQNTIRGLSENVQIYDREKIEAILIDEKKTNLIKRYFPESYKKILNEKFAPANILSKYIPLSCDYCGSDLLTPEKYNLGIIVFVVDTTNNIIEDIYWSCKGKCDHSLENHYPNFLTQWEDISDIMIPSKYISWVCAILNRVRDGDDIYTDKAFEKLKQFLISVSQLVFRNQNQKDLERIQLLMSLPII